MTRSQGFSSLVTLAVAASALAGCQDLALEPSQQPGSIRIEPQDLFIMEGETGNVRVVVLDQNDREMTSPPTWAPPQWNIEEAALTIHPDGTVEGHKGGFNRAIARVGGHSAAVVIKVQPDEVALSANTLYINQAAQNRDASVPVIAGRSGLLRAFVLGDEGSFYEPTVAATLFLNGEEVYSTVMEPESDYLPSRVDESRLDRSFNAVIPGEHIQPGLEVVLDMDVSGVVPLRTGASKRWPENGRVAIDVHELPTMKLMVVPTLMTLFPDRAGAVNWVKTVTTTSTNSRVTRLLRPIADFEITIREPFTTDADLTTGAGWGRYLDEITALRALESHLGYYYGAVQLPPGSAWGGLGWVGYPAGVGSTNGNTMAHEVGHNMNLRHAPCGGAGGPDPSFPTDNADIGIYGYDVEGSRLMGALDFKDDMSYCDPTWVSDYHFARAIQFRLEAEPFTDAASDRGTKLYVSGSVDGAGVEFYPSYVFEAGAKTPEGVGPYSLVGLTQDGSVLFSYRFTPRENGNGGAGFHFTLPYENHWATELDRIRVSGPAGEAVLTHNSQPATAIVMDAQTDQVVAITSDLGGATASSGRIHAISAGLPVFDAVIR